MSGRRIYRLSDNQSFGVVSRFTSDVGVFTLEVVSALARR
jgi:hypothetical protein